MTRELTGRHIVIILGALFGVVFAVNGVFAYLAIAGFPGLETDGAYRKGLAFNQQITRAETLRALGWTVTVTQSAPDNLTLRFNDKDGAPLAVSAVAATLFHPTSAGGDKALSFIAVTPGIVSATLDGAAKGQRDLRITARASDGRRIEFRRSLWID